MWIFKYKFSFILNLITFYTFMVLTGCGGCNSSQQREYDAKEIEPITIRRFEKQLFSVPANQPAEGLTSLKKEYQEFYFYYAQDMLSMPYQGDSLFTQPMRMLLDYKPFKKLQTQVDSFYNDLSIEEKAITGAMSIYAAQFPDASIPSFISFISEFGYANVTFDGRVGIGLDMYMNETFNDYYRSLEFPDFMIRKLTRKYIVPNAIRSLAFSRFDGQIMRDKRFLANMIFEGKVRYFMKALLPNTPDSLIMGYTPQQMEWAAANEGEIWAHYAEKDLLFSTATGNYLRYLNDGPFTSADGVPQASAPMIGIWSGWKIVQAYMRKNPQVSLQQLMLETDFDKILKSSGYKPE